MSGWLNDNDIKLEGIMDDIKDEMNRALDQIEKCNSDPLSDYNTDHLEKGIRRFIEDYC